MLGGKLVAFMALNWVQLLLMLLVGRWLVPLLGGDALYLELATRLVPADGVWPPAQRRSAWRC